MHCATQWKDGRKHSFDDKETDSDKQVWLVGLSGTQEKLDRQEGQADLSGPSNAPRHMKASCQHLC